MESEARPRSDVPAAPAWTRPPASPADAAMRAYVGLLAGWFDLGQLAAGRRLQRGGVEAPLLTDL